MRIGWLKAVPGSSHCHVQSSATTPSAAWTRTHTLATAPVSTFDGDVASVGAGLGCALGVPQPSAQASWMVRTRGNGQGPLNTGSRPGGAHFSTLTQYNTCACTGECSKETHSLRFPPVPTPSITPALPIYRCTSHQPDPRSRPEAWRERAQGPKGPQAAAKPPPTPPLPPAATTTTTTRDGHPQRERQRRPPPPLRPGAPSAWDSYRSAPCACLPPWRCCLG